MNQNFISKSNFVLRKVLNTKKCIDILKELIEVILDIKIKYAKINPYLESKKGHLPAEENFGIADLRVVTNTNEVRNIGIQIIDGRHILTKMLLYYGQIHYNQLEYDKDRMIASTNTINILNFVFREDLGYHSKMLVKRPMEEGLINNCYEMHIIQLPKFNLKDNKICTLKQAWISYIKGENITEAISKSEKIKKLNILIEKYWEDETME